MMAEMMLSRSARKRSMCSTNRASTPASWPLASPERIMLM